MTLWDRFLYWWGTHEADRVMVVFVGSLCVATLGYFSWHLVLWIRP